MGVNTHITDKNDFRNRMSDLFKMSRSRSFCSVKHVLVLMESIFTVLLAGVSSAAAPALCH